MRPQDAQDILRIIEDLWAFDMGERVRRAWRPVIEEFEDAALVTEAVIGLATTEQYRPTLALIKDAVKLMERKRAPQELPEGVPTFGDMPFWVKRWFYARFIKTPPDLRPLHEQFPERHGNAPPPNGGEWMPDDLYVEEARRVPDETVVPSLTG